MKERRLKLGKDFGKFSKAKEEKRRKRKEGGKGKRPEIAFEPFISIDLQRSPKLLQHCIDHVILFHIELKKVDIE
jgi:hypothetical protein